MRYVHFTAAAVAALLCATFAATAAQAQSLADVARREEERRKAIGSPGRVYTNDNLPVATSGPPVPPPAAAVVAVPAASGTSTTPAPGASASTPAGSTAAANPAAKDEGVKKGEAYWRQRLQQARDAQQRAEVVVAALQSRINALTSDAVNRDDPAQRGVITADREKALQEMERVKKDMQQLAQAITDIQEEARRGGVPAGWVR